MKKGQKNSGSNWTRFIAGLVLGILIGLIIGGSINLTGNVVEGECDPLCGSGEECQGGICMPIDSDYDGYDVNSDCNDNDANVYPGNWEQCGDSVDNDCDSSTPDTCPTGETCSAGICMDETTGGTTPPVQTTGECVSDPECAALYGTGYTCDIAMGYCSESDNDFDGYGVTSDCNDNDANVYPGNWEQCGDSVDNDCDSSTPDTCPTGETCSAGICMDETTGGTTPPV